MTANPLPVALIINGKRKDRSIHYRQKMVNRFGLIRLTQKLISIDSENPPGDESRIAAFVRDYLRRLGLKVEIYQFQKNRPNVLAYFLTKGAKHSLLLSPHLDTVPAGKSWTKDPFSGAIIKKKIYGLGATDCKGNLACALETLKSLVEEKVSLRYNLIFAATADEECGSTLGLVPLLEKRILRPDAALVLDAEEFEVIIAQKGLVHLRVKIQGRRAHGAYPWRGVNAISITLDILQALKFFKFRQRKHSYLRPPTINIGTIRGGDKVNVVADHCEFELDFRFLPGESPAGLVQELKYLIQKYVRNFKVELMSIQQPYSIDKEHPLVQQLVEAGKKNKIKPVLKGSEGATVITFFQEKNIPAIATGFGSKGCAHIADEYVAIDNLYKGTLVLEEFLRSYRFNLIA